jgi:hypothetical protein
MTERKRPFGLLLAALCTLGVALACSSGDGKGDDDDDSSGLPAGEACETNEVCESGRCTIEGICAECPGGICIDDPSVSGAQGGTEEVDDARAQALRDAACVGWSGEAEPESPILMFVVDVSTSMKQPDPSDTTQTKWEVTQPVLQQAIADLPDSIAVGLLLYPYLNTSPSDVARSSSECVNADAMVPIDVLGGAGSDQRSALSDRLDGSPLDESGTPTHDAITIALHELEHTSINGSRYLVLLTDGQPTYSLECIGDGQAAHAVNEQPIIDEIASALGDAVGTFVIGAPGSEATVEVNRDARDWLSMAAEAGGTAPAGCSHDGDPEYCHFDMVDAANYAEGLSQALLDIAEQVVPCDYGLPAPPTGRDLDPSNVNVIFTASSGSQKLLLKDDDPSCTEGWHWSEDESRVLLCPDSCRELRLDRLSRLDVLFGCESIVEIQ